MTLRQHSEAAILIGTPESFGWLRVPAFDCDGAHAYERPNGSVVLLDPCSRTVSVAVPQRRNPWAL